MQIFCAQHLIEQYFTIIVRLLHRHKKHFEREKKTRRKKIYWHWLHFSARFWIFTPSIEFESVPSHVKKLLLVFSLKNCVWQLCEGKLISEYFIFHLFREKKKRMFCVKIPSNYRPNFFYPSFSFSWANVFFFVLWSGQSNINRMKNTRKKF